MFNGMKTTSLVACRVPGAMWIVGIALTAGLPITGSLGNALGAPPCRAEDILDRFVEVTGGKKAYAKLENRVSKITLEPVGSGMKMDITNYAAKPCKIYTTIEAPTIGKMEKGTDGDIVWETSLMTGPVIKEGEERALTLRAASFDKDVNWRKLFPKVDCVGVEAVDGKPTYKVVMKPSEGAPETRYFDKESGLLVKVELTLSIPMGTIPIELFLSDYRPVDGVLFAHKIRRFNAGQEVLITTTSIEHNVKMAANRFDLPDEIAALVNKRSADGDDHS